MDELLRQLTDLFHRLRGAGMPLGVDELMSLQRALHHGFGLADLGALKRLCRLVWLVSPGDQPLFEYHFKNAVTLTLPIARQAPDTAAEPPTEPDLDHSSEQPQTPPPSPVEARQELPHPAIEPKAPEPPLPTLSGFDTRFAPDEGAELAQIVDDVHVQAQVVMAQTSAAETLMAHQQVRMHEFLPISRRELQQSWRYLRRMARSGPARELDAPATVRRAARDGYLVNPVMVPRRKNQSALLLLLDQKGSMVPFHFLCRAVAETATAAGSFGQVGVYYFHNAPPLADTHGQTAPTGHYREHLLYTAPPCIDAKPVSEILVDFKTVRPDVLIFSDAGAARKTWNAARIEETALFLFQLQTLGVEQFAWLNPLPPPRWQDTSAAAMAEFVPMFPLSHSGLRQAIRTLNSGSRYTLNFVTA
ncbi:MAG: hypothetical protein R2911_20925 [Caldilineaceae bacterium]